MNRILIALKLALALTLLIDCFLCSFTFFSYGNYILGVLFLFGGFLILGLIVM